MFLCSLCCSFFCKKVVNWMIIVYYFCCALVHFWIQYLCVCAEISAYENNRKENFSIKVTTIQCIWNECINTHVVGQPCPEVFFLFSFISVFKYYVVNDTFCSALTLFNGVVFVPLIMLTCRVDVSKSHTPSLHQMPDLLLEPFLAHFPS